MEKTDSSDEQGQALIEVTIWLSLWISAVFGLASLYRHEYRAYREIVSISHPQGVGAPSRH